MFKTCLTLYSLYSLFYIFNSQVNDGYWNDDHKIGIVKEKPIYTSVKDGGQLNGIFAERVAADASCSTRRQQSRGN